MTQDNTPKITVDVSTLAELLREAASPRPLTPAQIGEQNARALAEGEASALRAADEKRATLGLPRPTPGMKLIVRCAKTLGRRRAGIDFSVHPAMLEVTTLSTKEAKASRPENGEGPISVDEAILILADDALAVSVVAARGYGETDAAADQLAQREASLRAWEDDLLSRAQALSAREADAAKGASRTGAQTIERGEVSGSEVKSDRSFDTGENTPAANTVLDKPKTEDKADKPEKPKKG